MDNASSVPPASGSTPPPLGSGAPPVITPPPPLPAAARRRRSAWRVLGILLLLGLAAFAGLMFLGSLFSGMVPTHGRSATPRLEEFVLEDTVSPHKIAILELEGIIVDGYGAAGRFSPVEIIRTQLRRATEDSRVKAVVLKVNSPGGEVLAADQIYRAIAEFQRETDKPVVATMGSLAASGGYYVSAPCRWIVAHDVTITGSIGVILQTLNYRGLMDKVGLRPFTFKSGKFKDMLSGAREPEEISAEEKEMVQALIDETYEKFKRAVAEGRSEAKRLNGREGQALDRNWEEFADGRVLSGTEAFRLGFVDELGDFQTAVARARKLADIPHAKVVLYRPRVDLADILGLFGGAEARRVKVDWGVELPPLQPGRLYFLSPSLLPVP